jgi:hypothetical protein
MQSASLAAKQLILQREHGRDGDRRTTSRVPSLGLFHIGEHTYLHPTSDHGNSEVECLSLRGANIVREGLNPEHPPGSAYLQPVFRREASKSNSEEFAVFIERDFILIEVHQYPDAFATAEGRRVVDFFTCAAEAANLFP